MSRKKQTVRLGSYARLSRDDGEDGVSNSIVNQQQIMRQYCERHAGLAIVREYADDGFSGTTFDRPAWRELEADLEGGVIDGFIVKDS
ncbi:recombinase family protein, partial [Eggerthella sp.]